MSSYKQEIPVYLVAMNAEHPSALSPDPALVFHGSCARLEMAIPRRHQRIKKDALGIPRTIFDQESYHASPYRWIAIAYTYHPQPIPGSNPTTYFNMGVDLYRHKKQLDIYGIGSLEESLKVLYAKGGYVSTFRADDFFHTDGLGHLEVITTKPVEPLSVEYIEDPVGELRKAGIRFRFVDAGEDRHKNTGRKKT